jgi:hypothetical protein
MHRYRILARISLILFSLNLVLAAPAVVREIHEARADNMVVGEPSSSSSPHDGVTGTTQNGVTETTQGGVTETTQGGVAGASHDGEAGPSHDASSQHSFDSSLSGHSWLMNGPTLSPDRPNSVPSEFFDENMMRKIKVGAGVGLIGTAIAGIVGASLIGNHKHRDFEDSST